MIKLNKYSANYGEESIEIKEKVPVISINNGTQKYIINHLLQKIW
jgi:hypothetical protein